MPPVLQPPVQLQVPRFHIGISIPFRMQVLTHSRQMQKHPYAGAALLEDNAPVVIHLGASVEGYTAKMCRTVFLGTPPEACVEIYRVLRRAQETAVARLRPGVTCGRSIRLLPTVWRKPDTGNTG